MAIYGNIENVDAVLLATVTAEVIHVKGADGITPHIGDNGNWYLGATDTGKPSRGEQGLKGDTGAAGPQGIQGIQGPQGERGPAGADGVAGPQGPKGDKGDTGPQGPKGDTGATGATGPQGPKGDKGDTGAAGPAGAPGIYYGTTQPTGDTHPVWIDPGGDQDDGGLLPVVTATDNGKFLRVVSGAWAAVEISNANGVSF